MRLLAHRGFWDADVVRNSDTALDRAAAHGYGVETDIRDRDGEIVVSHDMPTGDASTLRSLLRRRDPRQLPLALNVKADGQAGAVAALLAEFDVTGAFVFDMSIPDHLAWLAAGVPALTRWSDLEPDPVLFEESAGVWLDAMRSDLWWEPSEVDKVLETGRTVALVSPELHRRDHLPVWDHVRSRGWHRSPDFLLCTDFPDDAERFLT